MFIHKLRAGVLHILTPSGLRCIRLTTTSERILLLWVFRHFKVLPEKVLGKRSRMLIGELLNGNQPIERCACIHPDDDEVIIGTLDCHAHKSLPSKDSDWGVHVNAVTTTTRT